jgi:hypothetical protein
MGPMVWPMRSVFAGLLIGLCACTGRALGGAPSTSGTPIANTPLESTGGAAASRPPSGSPDCSGFPAAQQRTHADAKLVRVVCLKETTGPVAALEEEQASATGADPPVPVVELFSRGPNGWSLLADLSRIPAGAPLVGMRGQLLENLDPVDFSGQGGDWLVVGVLSVGASTGPLEVSVLSFRSNDVAIDKQIGTMSGGTATVRGNSVLIETGAYQPGDPHCCPSGVLRERLAWNPMERAVEVVDQEVTAISSRS